MAQQFAGADTRRSIEACAQAEKVSVQTYAHAVLNQFVVQLVSIAGTHADEVEVKCCTIGGKCMAVIVDRPNENNIDALRSKVARLSDKRKAPTSIIMPSGSVYGAQHGSDACLVSDVKRLRT